MSLYCFSSLQHYFHVVRTQIHYISYAANKWQIFNSDLELSPNPCFLDSITSQTILFFFNQEEASWVNGYGNIHFCSARKDEERMQFVLWFLWLYVFFPKVYPIHTEMISFLFYAFNKNPPKSFHWLPNQIKSPTRPHCDLVYISFWLKLILYSAAWHLNS